MSVRFLFNKRVSAQFLKESAMARMKDETKRQSIIQSAKMLFSQKGFYNTSISDIVHETGFPVGTIYTYFKSKDGIVQTIVEEGWTEWYQRLALTVSSKISAEKKFQMVIDESLPELFRDIDLVNILLSEAIAYTHIEEKLEKLTDLILSLLKPMTSGNKTLENFPRSSMEAAVTIFFLGIINAVKIARSTSIGVKESDITSFMKTLIENSFGIKLSTGGD